MTDLLYLFGQVFAVAFGGGLALVLLFGILLTIARKGQESADKAEARHVIKWEEN